MMKSRFPVVRLRRATMLAVTGSILLGGLTTSAPVSAQIEEPDVPTGTETTPEVVDGGYVVQASEVGSLRVVDQPSAGPLGAWIECRYFDAPVLDSIDTGQPRRPREAGLYALNCYHEPEHVLVAGYPVAIIFDPPDPVPGLVDVFDVARYALAQQAIEPPAPELRPPITQVTGVPTWLAVTSTITYPEITAQAGLAWATVRATFRDVEWDLGDGSVVVCTADAARRFDPARAVADQHSSCVHTYTEPTPAPHQVSVTATWDLDWANNEAPDAFVPWDVLALNTTVAVPVVELQAVIR